MSTCASSECFFYFLQDGVKVETVTENSPEISVVKRSKIKRDKAKFGTFIKVTQISDISVHVLTVFKKS